jgi:long-chain acyl-CoA synthetase
VSVEALRAHCDRHLADFKVPRWIDVVDSLPRDPVGKVLKRRLRDERWAGRGTNVV